MGLQKDRDGKRAIFSIWGGIGGSSSAPGAISRPFTEISCRDFPGGWQIMVPLPWTTHTYRFRVWKLGLTPIGQEYGAWILDTNTGDETMIGTITVPASWKGIKADGVLFSEWYGGNFPSCFTMPRSDVRFAATTANGGTATATFTGQVDVGGACPGTHSFSGGWVREILPR